MSGSYCYLHLRGKGRDNRAMLDVLRTQIIPQWQQIDISVWGMFNGLFGVASNELIVVAATGNDLPLSAYTRPLSGIVKVRKLEHLDATVRPVTPVPCEKGGIYVFRSFYVFNEDVAEIARLSNEAWTTFENAGDYSAQPMGLFCQRERTSRKGKMLLVTWYDSLTSWETSREPPAQARRNFLQRHFMTRRTVAIATRLIAPQADA